MRDSVHRRTDFDQSPDFAMRMDAQDRECLEQCPSCPVRRRRMQREAKLMEEMNYRNTSRYFSQEREIGKVFIN